jgi:hypothetical protein
MTEEPARNAASEHRDEHDLIEDLEPTAEAAREVTGGRETSAPKLSEITIQKPIDKASP